jgi:cytochrome P450
MATTTAVSPTKPGPLPGPKGHWLWGNLGDFKRDRLGFLADCARNYGDMVALRLGPRHFVLLSHPDLIERVLVDHHRQVTKHFALRLAKRTLGEGLLTSEGDFWRRQRRLAQPAFHRDRVAGHAAMMVAFAGRMLDGWADGQARDVQDDMMRLTLEIVAKALFDADVSGDSAEVSAAMEANLRSFSEQVGRLVRLPRWLPTPSNLRAERSARRLDAVIYRIIAERRATGADRNDLLSMLIRATDDEAEGGGSMTDRQLRDEAMTLFMAGHETTANTLAWAFYLLSQHPDAEAKLHDELDSVLGDRPPTVDDVPRLVYTDRVVTETLRILPTVWLLGREVVEPFELNGHRMEVGTTLWMSQWVVHRDPRWFDDPESFRPDRWADGLARRLHKYAYFPFGGGPRLCIGAGFAQMEAVLLLSAIARRYRLPLAPDARIALWPSMTLRPDHGVRVVPAKRR